MPVTWCPMNSDADYLVLPKAGSRMSGCFQLSKCLRHNHPPFLNGATLVVCKVLHRVVSLTVESESAGVFHNFQLAIPIRHMLESLNHAQPATPIKTKDSSTHGFVNNNIHQKRSKSWDMRCHWLREKNAMK